MEEDIETIVKKIDQVLFLLMETRADSPVSNDDSEEWEIARAAARKPRARDKAKKSTARSRLFQHYVSAPCKTRKKDKAI